MSTYLLRAKTALNCDLALVTCFRAHPKNRFEIINCTSNHDSYPLFQVRVSFKFLCYFHEL